MNRSAFALPPELWIPTLALTRKLLSWLPTSTRILSRLLQSTPLLDKALRTPVAHELLLAVRVTHTDECFYDGEGYYSHHHVIHHLFTGSLDLSPQEYTPTSQDGQDHPLQALLHTTSSVRNRKNALCDQVYQLLVHPGTVSGLLTRHSGQSELLAQESLPHLIEHSFHRQKEWSSDLTLNPLLLACIYASHFIFTGNSQRLFEVLNRFSRLLLPDRAILSSARHAASPLRWSLAVADSLTLQNAPRKFCDSAHVGTYVKNLELSFFDFGGPPLSSTEVMELDRPFHMTFAEYLVWLALFYWRVDVAHSLVDRFGIDIVQVTRRVFNQPKLDASVLHALPRLDASEEQRDLGQRVIRQIEWMARNGWELTRVSNRAAFVDPGLREMVVICKYLPVSKAIYPSFVEVFRRFDEQLIITKLASIPALVMESGMCAKVAAYVALDPSFVDLVPFVIEHIAMFDDEWNDNLVDLMLALMRADQKQLTRELLGQYQEPEQMLSQAFMSALIEAESPASTRPSTTGTTDVLESLVSLDTSVSSAINWTQALCAHNRIWRVRFRTLQFVLFDSPALSSLWDHEPILYLLLERPSHAPHTTNIHPEGDYLPHSDQLDLVCLLFQHLESQSTPNRVWERLRTSRAERPLDPLYVLVAHLLHLVNPLPSLPDMCPASAPSVKFLRMVNHDKLRGTITQLVNQLFLGPRRYSASKIASYKPLAPTLSLLTTHVVLPALTIEANSVAHSLLEQHPNPHLFAFQQLALTGLARELVPWSTIPALPPWMWSTAAAPAAAQVSEEVVEREMRRILEAGGWDAVEDVVKKGTVPHWGDEMRAKLLGGR